MRRFIRRNIDTVFVMGMVAAFVGVAFFAMNQRRISMAGWQTDFSKRDVSLGEIIALGQLETAMLMAIDEPRWQMARDVDWLAPASPVIAVRYDGLARAYPLAVMLYHQVVNDEMAGMPIAITYCPLCNSAIVFERRLDEHTLRFGVSGNVRNSGFIMYDDRTQSWWQQFTGRAIVGAYTGEMLAIVPSQVVGFATFAQRYPDGWVLAGDEQSTTTRYARTPMEGYDSRQQPIFYDQEVDPRLPAMERVLTAVIGDQAVAYPFSTLARMHVVNHQVGDVPVVVLWQPGALSVLDNISIDASQDVGMAAMFVRQIDDQMLSFMVEDGVIRDKQTHSEWNIFGECVRGDLAGHSLRTVESFPHFWFAWAATYPQTLLYGMQPMP